MYARYIPPPRPKPAPAAEPTESPAEAEHQPEARRGVATAPAPPVPSDSFSYARYVPPPRAPAPAPAKASSSEVSAPVDEVEEKKRKRGGEEDGREGKKVKAVEEVPESDEEDKENIEDAEPADVVQRPALSEKEEKRRRKEEQKRKKEEKRQKAEKSESKDTVEESDATPKKTKQPKHEQPNGQPPAEPEDSDVEMTAPADDVPPEPKETKEEKKARREKKKKRNEAEEQEREEAVRRSQQAVLDRKEKALRSIRAPALPTPTEESPKPEGETAEEQPEVKTHGLEPLPQPAPVVADTSIPAFDGLPPWIAEPIRMEQSTRVPFTDLGIPEKVTRALETKGYKDAFAVQTAAIPLLMPTAKRLQGDVLVSAATGSGKTLTYAIPIVRDISEGVVTRLRALVVLPTRELVKQAKEAFETVSAAFDGQGRKRVRIGIAYGSQSLKTEQGSLITRDEVYDPEAARKAEAEEANRDALLEGDSTASGIVKGSLPDHVVSFGSAVDVLICTPGRLVDHIRQTPGFALEYVRWLVIDEGDKLLEQNYQNWIPTAMGALRAAESAAPLGARDFSGSSLSGVRKVFLSATLTSRGSLAAMRELELQRPRLVVLGGERAAGVDHVLPEKLREYTIRLRDENLKPLYLNELLLSDHLRNALTPPNPESESESDSDSESDSESDSGSDSSSDSDAGSKKKSPATKPAFNTTALIFTKSNESALRLTRLLTHLTPSLAPLIATLTSATPPHVRRRTITQFASHRIRILVASDLVARGIDLPLLDHVVNYDLPPSVEAYVHRVGRTARADREGCAWSLVPDGKEGGWFWGGVAKGEKISRARGVERVVLGEDGEIEEGRVEEYERALGELAKEASGRKGRE